MEDEDKSKEELELELELELEEELEEEDNVEEELEDRNEKFITSKKNRGSNRNEIEHDSIVKKKFNTFFIKFLNCSHFRFFFQFL